MLGALLATVLAVAKATGAKAGSQVKLRAKFHHTKGDAASLNPMDTPGWD